MSTPRRRTRAPAAHSITPAAVAAYRSGDQHTLHAELHLPPWQVSPLDAVGDCPWPQNSAGAITWPASAALRAELEA